MSFQKIIKIKGKEYLLKPSIRENKKYDVYYDTKYIISFGDKRYQHYKDKIGYYNNLNHNDKERRKLYRDRHKNDYINDPNYAGFWSWHYLW